MSKPKYKNLHVFTLYSHAAQVVSMYVYHCGLLFPENTKLSLILVYSAAFVALIVLVIICCACWRKRSCKKSGNEPVYVSAFLSIPSCVGGNIKTLCSTCKCAITLLHPVFCAGSGKEQTLTTNTFRSSLDFNDMNLDDQ